MITEGVPAFHTAKLQGTSAVQILNVHHNLVRQKRENTLQIHLSSFCCVLLVVMTTLQLARHGHVKGINQRGANHTIKYKPTHGDHGTIPV